MNYITIVFAFLFVFSCAKTTPVSILDDLRSRSDAQKEEVIAYLENGSVVKLTKNNTEEISFYNVERFKQLCKTEKRFLLVHTHVASHSGSSFPSPHYVKDGKSCGDYGVIFDKEFFCESMAARKNIERAEITHALYDVTKDVFVVYDLGEVVKEKTKNLARKQKDWKSFMQEYNSTPRARAISEAIYREHINNTRTELFNKLNSVYWEAYDAYFTKRCKTSSEEESSMDCSSVSVWEFAEQSAHLSDYFTVKPCQKGEICVSF